MRLNTKIIGLFVALSMLSSSGCAPSSCPTVEAKYEVRDAVVQLTGNHDSTLEASRKATFRIIAVRPEGEAVGTATLFSYKGQQIVITAAHVVKGALGAFIESRYEIGVQRDLELMYYDEESDIAILLPYAKIETR